MTACSGHVAGWQTQPPPQPEVPFGGLPGLARCRPPGLLAPALPGSETPAGPGARGLRRHRRDHPCQQADASLRGLGHPVLFPPP